MKSETFLMFLARFFRSFAVLALCVGLASSAKVALAQEGAAKEEPATTAATQPSDAPYMEPLMRLSSILGSLNFLRTLCDDPQAGVWRAKMSELIEAQKPSDVDKRRLIASFNSGYRAFESTYRQCTASARTAVNRYQTEGVTLAREISARYGN